jgi:hypothetical protein
MFISRLSPKLIVILVMLASFAASAQEVLPDSILYENALASTTSKAMRSLKKINNGNEYTEIVFSLKHGHPFFLSEHVQSGDITYYGVDYSNVDFQYDLITDKIVVDHVSGRRISLVNEKITRFSINGNTFKRIDPGQRISPGFYQFLVDGEKIKLIVLRKKKIDGYDRNKFPYISGSTDYYVIKDNEFTFVRNYKSILKLLGDDKTMAASLNRSASDEDKMIAVVKQYERLNK